MNTELMVQDTNSALTVAQKEIFPSPSEQFLTVFTAEWSTYRIVFWYEHRTLGGNRTILRRVKAPGRMDKTEDEIISIHRGPPDLDKLRLSIASFAQKGRGILTDIRWELYSNMELTALQEYGRFDHFDLLGRTPKDRLAQLIRDEHVSVSLDAGDWDFDGVLLLNICPICQTHLKREASLFYFEEKWSDCPKCKWPRNNLTSMCPVYRLAQKFLFRLAQTPDALQAMPVGEMAPTAKKFIDVVTPLLCWIFCQSPGRISFIGGKFEDLTDEQTGIRITDLKTVLGRSLFPKLMDETFSDEFETLFRDIVEAKLHELKSGAPSNTPEGWTPEHHREWLIQMWEETGDSDKKMITVARNLMDIFINGVPILERSHEHMRAITEGLSSLPLTLEDLLTRTANSINNKRKDLSK